MSQLGSRPIWLTPAGSGNSLPLSGPASTRNSATDGPRPAANESAGRSRDNRTSEPDLRPASMRLRSGSSTVVVPWVVRRSTLRVNPSGAGAPSCIGSCRYNARARSPTRAVASTVTPRLVVRPSGRT